MPVVVGTYILDLFIPEALSLKGKRFVLKRVFDKVKAKGFNVSISEVDQNNKWQRSLVAVSTVGNSAQHVNSTLDKALFFIEELGLVEVLSAKLDIYTIGELQG